MKGAMSALSQWKYETWQKATKRCRKTGITTLGTMQIISFYVNIEMLNYL